MIYILTYNDAHRKTYDVLNLLKACGHKDVTVIALPYHYTKKQKPLINHRPQVYAAVSPDMLCKALDYKYEFINSFAETTQLLDKKPGPILICGAGIIPADLIDKYLIINSHPGILPMIRGLDAFKWAIYEMQPIGVTTHIIDHEPDAGFLIDQKIIEVTWGDSFHSLAQKQYEMEITMLVDALDKVKNIPKERINTEGFPVHKRMGQDLEKQLFLKFEEYKRKFAAN